MNKRIKKKWSRMAKLENKVAQLSSEKILLMEAVKRHTTMIEEIYSINSINAQATNRRFEQLEAENKALREDLDKLRKGQKKSLFSRR